MSYKIGDVFENDYPNDLFSWCENNNAYILQKGTSFIVTKNYEPTLDELKTAKLTEVDTWTASKITAGLISDCTGYTVLYDSDRDTQTKLDLALSLVNAGILQAKYPQGFPVRGYKQLEDGSFETDKTIILFSADAVKLWNADFGEHLLQCTQDGWAKQKEVNAATSKEELDAIVLE